MTSKDFEWDSDDILKVTESLLKKQSVSPANAWVTCEPTHLFYDITVFLSQPLPTAVENELSSFRHKYLLQLFLLFFCATGLLLTSNLAVNEASDGMVQSS